VHLLLIGVQQKCHLPAAVCLEDDARRENREERMASHPLSVLFICTGNSARSIMAEAYLNAAGKGRFVAHSAGSHPAGAANPLALDLLRKNRIDTSGLRSKSWDEFAHGTKFDFVFTVCDQAAGEVCPVWPGQPLRAHWGITDPAQAMGSEEDKRRAFFRAYNEITTRLNLFLSLPMDKLDRLTLQKRLEEIGAVGRETPVA
jgi:arsenate reductase